MNISGKMGVLAQCPAKGDVALMAKSQDLCDVKQTIALNKHM